MPTLPFEEVAYQIPISGPVPGAPMDGTARLVLRVAGGKAKSLVLELRPTQVSFMAKLPKLLKESGFPGDVFELGRAGSEGQPVLTYTAGAATLARLPLGLSSDAKIEAFLAPGPNVLDLSDYRLSAIAFEKA